MLAHVQVDSNRPLNKCTLGTVRTIAMTFLFFLYKLTGKSVEYSTGHCLLVLTTTVLLHSEQSDKIPMLSYGDIFHLERVVQDG